MENIFDSRITSANREDRTVLLVGEGVVRALGGTQRKEHWKRSCWLYSHKASWTYWGFWVSGGFPGSSVVRNPPASAGNAGDLGSIPGSGRSPGGGHGNTSQYSYLENPMDRGAWQVTVHGIARVRPACVTEPTSSPPPQSACFYPTIACILSEGNGDSIYVLVILYKG